LEFNFTPRQRELIQKKSEYLGFNSVEEYMKFYILMDALEDVEELEKDE